MLRHCLRGIDLAKRLARFSLGFRNLLWWFVFSGRFRHRVSHPHLSNTAIHVVLDNLNTHKPKNDRWIKRHPNVRFHFTLTRASWLNQVEIWFSILQGKSLEGGSFTSVKQLRAHIDAFIETYNADAKPFVWTKSEVHQKRLKARFADQDQHEARHSLRLLPTQSLQLQLSPRIVAGRLGG
jgi:hypothetical protein